DRERQRDDREQRDGVRGVGLNCLVQAVRSADDPADLLALLRVEDVARDLRRLPGDEPELARGLADGLAGAVRVPWRGVGEAHERAAGGYVPARAHREGQNLGVAYDGQPGRRGRRASLALHAAGTGVLGDLVDEEQRAVVLADRRRRALAVNRDQLVAG